MSRLVKFGLRGPGRSASYRWGRYVSVSFLMVLALSLVPVFPHVMAVESSIATIKISQSQNSNAVYSLTLVEIMDSGWNSTIAQPAFYVLGKRGLESSANISLPSKTLIQLTIISQDTPTPDSQPQQGIVSGTAGNTVYLINGTIAMGTNTSEQWGRDVISVPVESLAHTFSVPQLGINVPVVGGSTVIAYLYFNDPGIFQWVCLTPCGFGSNGSQGAMLAGGWMIGSVVVMPRQGVSSPPPENQPATGISFELVAMIAFGMIIVGFVAGLIVIWKFAVPKKIHN